MMKRGLGLATAYLPPSKPPIPSGFSPNLSSIDHVFLFPPPNVTGKLHMGHALTVTIQDAAIRYQRLRGKTVRWVFGTDHAGIATQSVVEKQLYKVFNPLTKRPTTRHDLHRNDFVEKVWEWTRSHKHHISSQLQLMGASLDYERENFTLDDAHSKLVLDSFVTLHKKGLLTRKLRMVNYCYQLQTCLSDLEVDQLQVNEPTELTLPNGDKCVFGVADDFAYKLEGGDGEIVVRTTRLETMWGDVALAVHPLDSRWSAYIGRHAIHPFTKQRIPIIADDVLVDPALGTGAVKVTPFHDESDFECAMRNDLPLGVNLFDKEGRMHHFADTALTRIQMRVRLRSELSKLGLYRGEAKHAMALPICSRSGDVIESVLKYQWFLDGKRMASKANVKSDKMTFYPKESELVFRDWLDKCTDWCVSRQLVWGHRIPAFRVKGTGERKWVVCKDVEEAKQMLKSNQVEQDEDVLDTWFSSGLLPLSLPQLKWMETGSDILFFWVARMVMLSVELQDRLPFPHVHLHALVRDAKGRKMSKSLGNVIDPIDVIRGASFDKLCTEIEQGNLTKREQAVAMLELKRNFPKGIPEFGSDALRLALASACGSQTITFDMPAVISARLFCNKLWQATRFVCQHAEETSKEWTLADRWIAQRLNIAMTTCAEAYEALDVDLAANTARKFVLEDLCDVYIECAKLNLNAPLLLHVLKCSLMMLNPVMPNVTTECFEAVFPGEELIWVENPPAAAAFDSEIHASMTTCLDIVRAIRALKQRFPHQREFVVFHRGGEDVSAIILDLAKNLTRVSVLTAKRDAGEERGAMIESYEGGYIQAVGSGGGANVALEADRKKKHVEECERLFKRQVVLTKEIQSIQARLNSGAFLTKAPALVLEKERKKLAECEHEYQILEDAKRGLIN